MTADLQLMPLKIECCDAPVTSTETVAEVQARLARAEQAAIGRAVLSLDDRHAARVAALRSMSDRADTVRMADQLIDRLVEGSSPREARQLLCIVRNCVTQRMNALIVAEYDAEGAANPGADFAQLAGRDGPSSAKGLFGADAARAIRDERGKVRATFATKTRELLQARAAGIERIDQSKDLLGNPTVTSISVVAEGSDGDGPDEASLPIAGNASEC